jgi:peptide/nickel transport system permease protein
VIENVFVLPGVGRLVFQAIANRDLVVVRDVVMLLAAVVVLLNFVVDLLSAWIDPRLRHA